MGSFDSFSAAFKAAIMRETRHHTSPSNVPTLTTQRHQSSWKREPDRDIGRAAFTDCVCVYVCVWIFGSVSLDKSKACLVEQAGQTHTYSNTLGPCVRGNSEPLIPWASSQINHHFPLSDTPPLITANKKKQREKNQQHTQDDEDQEPLSLLERLFMTSESLRGLALALFLETKEDGVKS